MDTATSTIAWPPSVVATLSYDGTALPPAANDLGDDPVGALVGAAGAVDRDPEVVHDHRRTPAREFPGVRARPSPLAAPVTSTTRPSKSSRSGTEFIGASLYARAGPYPLGQGGPRSRPVPWTDSVEQPTGTGGGSCVTSWS